MKEISDLGLIAGLITLGYAPVKREKQGKRVMFYFESDPQLEQLCQDFYDHRLMVNAFDMHMALKQVKTSIFQMENGAD
jgi:hypothetical protein